MPPKVERLPSGKLIMRWFKPAGDLACETHSYPLPSGYTDIGIRITFEDGRKTGEMYFGTVRSREAYEQRRHQYPDMPAADPSVTDHSAEELRKAEQQKRERAEAASRLGLDPSKLTELDLFCAMIMEKGRRADAVEWVQSQDRTLGEMDQPASRRLITKLTKLGAVAIHACQIQSYEGGRENTGHLVIELPRESLARSALLKALDRLARKQGFRGDPDGGQRFAYAKLD